jgi:hypothetical protein
MRLKTNSFLRYLPSLWRRFLWFLGFRPETYSTIGTLPIANWWGVHETGDVSLLMPNNKFKITNKLFDYCSELWDDIQQQHLDAFGEPDRYTRYLELEADAAIANLQHAITNDNWDLFLKEMAQSDLDQHIGEAGKPVSNIKRKQIIESILKMHYPIDPKTTTVEEYFNYEELAHEASNGQSN